MFMAPGMDRRPRTAAVWVVGVLAMACGRAGAWQESGAAALDPQVDRILTRLEARKIEDIRCQVRWTLADAIVGDEQVKLGELSYKDTAPVAKFIVAFKKQELDGRRRDLNERHLFDGRWYVELRDVKETSTRTVTRRELRRETDVGNPYRVGEGIFPLPFGQKKADILGEFEVVLGIGSGPDDPPDCDKLRLTPREGTRTAASYGWIDFWVARSGPLSGLPIKVRSAKKDGAGSLSNILTVTFSDVQVNRGISESLFRIETPAGFHEEIERLGDDAAPPAASAPGSPAP